MLIEIRSQNPDARQIKEVVDILKNGGVVIVPTDTIYAAVCLISNSRGIESLTKKLGKKVKRQIIQFFVAILPIYRNTHYRFPIQPLN